MSVFEVHTSEKNKKRGDDLLLMLKGSDGTQGSALEKMFDITERALETSKLKAEGVDIDGLDAALSNARNIYVGLASSRAESETAYTEALKEAQKQKEEMEHDLRDKVKKADAERELANAKAKAERQAADQLRAQIEQLNNTNNANAKLIESIEKERDQLKGTLASVAVKAQENEQILDKLKALESTCARLQHDKESEALESQKELLATQKNYQEKIEELQKIHQEEILTLRTEYEKELQIHRAAYIDLMHAKSLESGGNNPVLS